MSTPTASSPPPATSLRDFPDRLSPTLVKELRQGLRARTFIGVFLALQGCLALLLLMAVGTDLSGNTESHGEDVSRIIFFLVSIAVLVLQPMRGITAISSEIKGKTIDLMVLTRLSAWRIAFGKWIALVSQSALILTTIMPYLILRYFFGGMNLFAELSLLAFMFLASMLFTAVTVGLSAAPSLFFRWAPLIVGVPALLAFLAEVVLDDFDDLVRIFTLEDLEPRIVLGTLIALMVYLTWVALDFAGSMIAPLAENRSTPRRLFALLLTVATGVFFTVLNGSTSVDPDAIAWVMFPLIICLTPIISISLSEPQGLLPVICKPFVRRGIVGKSLGRFLYPGWPSGIIFVTLLFFFIFFYSIILITDEDVLFGISAWFATLLFPAVLMLPFAGRIRKRLAIYAIILASSILFSVLLLVITDITRTESSMIIFGWIPPVLFALFTENSFGVETFLSISFVQNILMLILLFMASFKQRHTIIQAEQAAMDSLTRTPPTSGNKSDEAPCKTES